MNKDITYLFINIVLEMVGIILDFHGQIKMVVSLIVQIYFAIFMKLLVMTPVIAENLISF